MKKVQISSNVLIFVTSSDPYGWPQHPEDVGAKKFITYIGVDDRNLLSRIVKLTPYPIKATLRKGERLPFNWELKIWGLSRQNAEDIAHDLETMKREADNE